MIRTKFIAGIPYKDYLKVYLIIAKGFPHVVKHKKDVTTIHPKKFLNIPFEDLETIYDIVKETLPYLFDEEGNLCRRQNIVKKQKKKHLQKSISPIVTFD